MSKNTLKLSALALAGLGTVMSGQAIAMDSAISIGDKKGDHWFTLGGLVQMDQVFFYGSNNDAASYPNGSNIRQAELALRGSLGSPDWTFYLKTDFSENRSATSGSDVKDASLTYTGYENMYFTIGQLRPVFGMEGAESNAVNVFMERSLATTAVRPGQGVGITAGIHGDMVNFMLSLYHGENKVAQARTGSEPLGLSGRATFAPVNSADEVWHFGASFLAQDRHNSDGGTVTFSTPPELTTGRGTGTLSTGALANVSEYQIYGFEMAGRWRDFLGQAEYFRLHADRSASNGGDLTFNGYYAQVSYVLTGEQRPYNAKKGTFGQITPASKDGAWEVALRHGLVDLRDKSAGAPGAEHNTTLGVNWWINEHVSFSANLVDANIPRSGQSSADVRGLGLRAQYVF